MNSLKTYKVTWDEDTHDQHNTTHFFSVTHLILDTLTHEINESWINES